MERNGTELSITAWTRIFGPDLQTSKHCLCSVVIFFSLWCHRNNGPRWTESTKGNSSLAPKWTRKRTDDYHWIKKRIESTHYAVNRSFTLPHDLHSVFFTFSFFWPFLTPFAVKNDNSWTTLSSPSIPLFILSGQFTTLVLTFLVPSQKNAISSRSVRRRKIVSRGVVASYLPKLGIGMHPKIQ